MRFSGRKVFDLTPLQWDQLCDSSDRQVDIVFDQDDNQAGQQAARALAKRLHLAGLTSPQNECTLAGQFMEGVSDFSTPGAGAGG